MLDLIQSSINQSTAVNFNPSDPQLLDRSVKEWKDQSKSNNIHSDHIVGIMNDNFLRFRVRERNLEALIFDQAGEIVRVIPPKDLMSIMEEFGLTKTGNLLDIYI